MTKLTKHDLRRKRLEILYEIDRLEKERCNFCADDALSHNTNKSSCDCHASVEVRKLGNQLLKLVSKRKDAVVKVIPNFAGLTIDNLTAEKYKEFKAQSVSDVLIMKNLNIGTHRFYKWKREVGLNDW